MGTMKEKNLGWHRSRLILQRKPQHVLEKLSTMKQTLMEQISTLGARMQMLINHPLVVLLTQKVEKVDGMHARRDVRKILPANHGHWYTIKGRTHTTVTRKQKP